MTRLLTLLAFVIWATPLVSPITSTGVALLVKMRTVCAGGEAPVALPTKKSPDGVGSGSGGLPSSATASIAAKNCGLFTAAGAVNLIKA